MMQTNRQRSMTFLSMYVAQSVPMSLFSTLLPMLMRQQDFSLTAIGLLQLIKLPWILKFLWAPLVDRYTHTMRDYKAWIFSSELLYALTILLIGFFRLETSFPLILILILFAFACSATQDIATDALATLCFRGKLERGNSIQCMGSFAGTILGGGVLVQLYVSWGWTALCFALATFVLVMLIPLYFYKDKEISYPEKKLEPIRMADIYLFFRQGGATKQVFFLMLYNAGLVGLLALFKPYLLDIGYSMGQIGWLFSFFGAGVGLFTSLLSAQLIRRVGRERMLLVVSSLIVLVAGFFALSALLQWRGIYAVAFQLALLWGTYGFSSVLIYTIAMAYVRSGREGTDFTLQIVLMHLGALVLVGLSGRVADGLGYQGFFLLEVLLAVLSLLFVLYSFIPSLRSRHAES